jgi:hypothetical protein
MLDELVNKVLPFIVVFGGVTFPFHQKMVLSHSPEPEA